MALSNKPTTKCFLDIEIAGKKLGRLTVNLYSDLCPKTCMNFRCLCTGEKGFSSRFNKTLHFKYSTFHRIVKGFMIQGGDFTTGDGKGGESIYGGPFEDENLTLKHDKPYLLSMANRGKDTNRSQFFITTAPAPHLDGVHVVFGELIDGFDIVREIENQTVDRKSRPVNKVTIINCGELEQDSDISDVYSGNTIQASNPDHKKRLLPKKYSSRRESVSPRRHSRSRSLSTSSSSSSSSSASSSSSSSASSSSLSSSSSSSVSSKSTQTSSASSDSSGKSSSSSSNSSKDNRSSSSGSYSRGSSSSSHKSSKDHSQYKVKSKRKVVKANLEVNSKVDDDGEDSDIIYEEKASIKKTDDDRDYPCSVKRDEIPEVPMNKFLFRPILKTSDENENIDSEEPFEVDRDLDRYKDRNSDNDTVDSTSNNNVSSTRLVNSAVTVVEKSTRVSRSGRTMKGRGSFKFRTPSPDVRKTTNYQDRRRRSRSPHRSRRRDDRDSRRDIEHSSSHRHGYNRSR